MNRQNCSGPQEPLVLDPPGFDTLAAWRECQNYSDRMHEAGGPIAAAFGADPGICSCPACGQMYWAWGRVQRCRSCGFDYPTDWWAMYSWGCQAGRYPDRQTLPALSRLHLRRMSHPYYRHGYEHPVADPWQEKDRIDWRSLNLGLPPAGGPVHL